jgi:hypothetical protein
MSSSSSPSSSSSSRLLTAVFLGGGAAALWGGCSPTEPTEIVAGVTTQIQVPKILKSVQVMVFAGGRFIECSVHPVVDGVFQLPGTSSALPSEDADSVPSEPITFSIIGFREPVTSEDPYCIGPSLAGEPFPDADHEAVLVVRRGRMQYLEDRIVYMPLPLRESCADVACDPDEETCIGGKCEPIDIDPSTVVDYQDTLLFGTSNTCFNTSKCMPDSLTLPAALVDPATCTFEIALPDGVEAPPPGHLNVRIVYKSFGSEILDLDSREGFTFPDPQNPLRFQLAPNLCESNYQEGKIIAVGAAPLCLAKRALQPICAGDLSEIQTGLSPNLIGNPDPDKSLCTVDTPLLQTESALYVLMDRSAAMSGFFGDEGLQFAVETPLQNPIAERTKLGFKFLPADASDCTGPSDYATPDIGFDVVANVREQIGAELGDATNVLGTNPPVFLDAALRPEGAYQALADLTPDVSTRFNRKAVLIIGNRDFVSSCAAAISPAQLAQDAFQTHNIHTYSVVLDAPGGTTLTGDPAADSAAISVAGNTEPYNAITDEAEGAKAVQEIVNDLGSCFYDIPANADQILVEEAELSYLNPLTFERTDIPRDDTCTEGNEAAIGWAREADGVRICGAPCAALRDMLTQVAGYYILQGSQVPPVPILVSAPCELVPQDQTPPDP